MELVRGVIVRTSPQGAPHAGTIELLTEILVPALLGRARVRVRLPKGPLYAAMGVPEFWLVDTATSVVEVYREPRADRYERMTALRAGASISLVAFPDVSIDVSWILPG